MPLNGVQCAKVVTLIETGHTVRQVANMTGYSRSSISRAVIRFRQTGSYERRPGSGRKRVTSARDDRYVVSLSLRNRFQTSVETCNELRRARGVNVSSRTVIRRLQENGLRAFRPATGPRLLVRHRQDRLRFARDHVNWTRDQWSRVLWTDESRFSLRSPDGRERVWRRNGERYAQCNISPRDSFYGGSIMVWGGITRESHTDLVVFNRGTVTAARYVEEVLSQHVVGFARNFGPGFILMQDNCRPHTARMVHDYLNEAGIEVMRWPACSPDLNPIEHVWDHLGRAIRSRRGELYNLANLRQAIREEWQNINQQVVTTIIDSMPSRLQAVIAARGGHTRF